MKTALSIAGSDPTGGAGFQADLKTFAAFGVHGLSAATALTAQSTSSISAVHPVPTDFFAVQLDTLLSDIRPDALKTGMLHNARIIDQLILSIKKYELTNLVIDPVCVSSSGSELLDEEGFKMLRDRLVPIARVITPNLAEAERLTGLTISSESKLTGVAERLIRMGPDAVVITGGHWEGETVDFFLDDSDCTFLRGKKIKGEFHGTGCAFSAALTASLAIGSTLKKAVHDAHFYVLNAITYAFMPGSGAALFGIRRT